MQIIKKSRQMEPLFSSFGGFSACSQTKSQCWKVTGRAICQEGADRWDPISHTLNGPVAAGAKLELRENNAVQREKRFHVFNFKASFNPVKLPTSTAGRAGNLDKSSSFCAASPVTAHWYPPPHLLRGKPIGHSDGNRRDQRQKSEKKTSIGGRQEGCG